MPNIPFDTNSELRDNDFGNDRSGNLAVRPHSELQGKCITYGDVGKAEIAGVIPVSVHDRAPTLDFFLRT